MVAESGRWGTFRTIWPADGAGDGRAGCLTEDRRRRRVLPPDRGRWWQKVADGGLFAQFGPQTEPAMAALAVSPKRGGGGLRGNHRQNQCPNRSPFRHASPNTTAKPRGESKTIPKTVRRIVRT